MKTQPKFGPTPLRRRRPVPDIGFHVGVLQPGQPNCYYHAEDVQEDSSSVRGVHLLVEGEERRLKAWDFVHCPEWTEHVFVATGDQPCLMIAVGGRRQPHDKVVYPVNRSHSCTTAASRPRRRSRTRPNAGTGDVTRIPYPTGRCGHPATEARVGGRPRAAPRAEATPTPRARRDLAHSCSSL